MMLARLPSFTASLPDQQRPGSWASSMPGAEPPSQHEARLEISSQAARPKTRCCTCAASSMPEAVPPSQHDAQVGISRQIAWTKTGCCTCPASDMSEAVPTSQHDAQLGISTQAAWTKTRCRNATCMYLRKSSKRSMAFSVLKCQACTLMPQSNHDQ